MLYPRNQAIQKGSFRRCCAACVSFVFLASCVVMTASCLPRQYSTPLWQVDASIFPVSPTNYPSRIFSNAIGETNKLAVDAMGNSYIAGLDIGASVGGLTAFSLAKYDTAGKIVWSKSILNTALTYPGPDWDSVKQSVEGSLWLQVTREISVKVDEAGNVYVLTPHIADPQIADMNWYLAKYDTQGALVWEHFHTSPTPEIEVPLRLLVEHSNRLYVHAANEVETRVESVLVAFDGNGVEQWEWKGPSFARIVDQQGELIAHEYTRMFRSRIRLDKAALYFPYFELTYDAVLETLQLTPVVKKVGATGNQVWEFRDATTQAQASNAYLPGYFEDARFGVLGADIADNVYVLSASKSDGETVIKKVSNSGTNILWQSISSMFRFPILAGDGVYTWELNAADEITVFTKMDLNGQVIFSKTLDTTYVRDTGSGFTIKLSAQLGIGNFFRDAHDRFYIEFYRLECSILRCPDVYQKLVVFDSSATELATISLPLSLRRHYAFDNASNLYVATEDTVASSNISKFDINSLIGKPL